MNRPAMEASIMGIQCDADGCDYLNKHVTQEDYELWVNAACPECGANLLTEADYELVKTLTAFSEAINELFSPLPKDDPIYELEIKMDGSGIPQIIELGEVNEN